METEDNNAELAALGKANAILRNKFAFMRKSSRACSADGNDTEDYANARVLKLIEQLGWRLHRTALIELVYWADTDPFANGRTVVNDRSLVNGNGHGITFGRGKISTLRVDNHGGKIRLGCLHPVNRSIAGEFPERATCADLLDMEFEKRPRADRLAEFHLVDGGKEHKLVIGFTTKRDTRQTGGGLRHGFDNQHPRHDGIVWKMPGKERLTNADHLDANSACVGNNLLDTFNEQHRRSVWDPFLDLVDIKLGDLFAHGLLFSLI